MKIFFLKLPPYTQHFIFIPNTPFLFPILPPYTQYSLLMPNTHLGGTLLWMWIFFSLAM